MKSKPIFPCLLVNLLSIFLLFGCAPNKQYTYETIQKEYSTLICAMTPMETERTQSQTCALLQPVSLADAISIALENSPDKRMALARIRKSEAMINEAEAHFYPYVGFYTEYTAADAPSAYLFKTIDQRKLPADADFNDPGRLDNFESGINAKMNLYNGGRDTLHKQMAETDLRLSETERKAVDNRLIAAVITAFYDALAAKEFIKISEESVATVKKQLKIMRVRFEGGSALKSDILSLKVRLAQSQEEAVRSRNRYQLAVTALSSIMGVSPDPVIRLKETPVRAADDIPQDYLSGAEYSLAHRPELNRLRDQVVKSRMALDMARSTRLPTVDLQGRYYLDDENMSYDLDRDNWTVAVMFNWDLFTGFSTKAAEKKAASVLEETLAADRQNSLAVKQDVKNAYLNLEDASARLKVARSSVDMAEESLKLVKTQYEGGSSNITRYLEAELDRNRAKIRSTAAFYDREKALADIGRAIGFWAKAGKPQEYPNNNY